MPDLSEQIAAILNLKTNASIADEIADRQLLVISKAYQHLIQPGNNVIYIADEVGLGKTYIALGILMLFRHFNPQAADQKDVIIVPKSNLQQKWQKEFKNFLRHNYKPKDGKLTHLEDKVSLKERVYPVRTTDALSIYRMTSFSSLGNSGDSGRFFQYLQGEVFRDNSFCQQVLQKAWDKDYFKKDDKYTLNKLLAYLLNVASEPVKCLVVDEAHNYKHGIGVEGREHAIRNEVTARFLGTVTEDSILEEFPELKAKIKTPLAQKVICLSATPKDRSLLEIKNQLGCFSNQHPLLKAKDHAAVEQELRSFLIRGNMEYRLGKQKFSRNMCRQEYRKGNVNKAEAPTPLAIPDSFDSVFWQLLQYQSIKHLNEKCNASFEIGMLAGFESYQVDLSKKLETHPVQPTVEEETENGSPDKEYEQTAHRTQKESQDLQVVKSIVDSYHQTFTKIPPHPKQDRLEEEIMHQLRRQEKSLIFVRRVATARELEQRILQRFEQEIVMDELLNFSGRYARFNQAPNVEKLKESYRDRTLTPKLPDFFKLLIPKLKPYPALAEKLGEETASDDTWRRWLYFTYHNNPEFKEAVRAFIRKKQKNFTQAFKQLGQESLLNSFDGWQQHLIQEAQEEENPAEFEGEADGPSKYFFNDYFKQNNDRSQEAAGASFRRKLYRENWFELNFLLIIQRFNLLYFPEADLLQQLKSNTIVNKDRKTQVFDQYQQAVRTYLGANAQMREAVTYSASWLPGLDEKYGNTFLTDLLLTYCRGEMENWLAPRMASGKVEDFLKDLSILNTIIRNIFRNGSGLLPAFVADIKGGDFTSDLKLLIAADQAPFRFVLEEVKIIIRDYDLLVAVNFQEQDETKINTSLRNLSPVLGISGQDTRSRSIVASQFRMPGYPYVMVTTDIFREGEDLHTYCQNVYHYGIAWNPSDMEQRTGRIDRINSMSYRKLNNLLANSFDNKVHVFYPYLTQSVEVNQVIRLLHNMNQFIETFNDIEQDHHFASEVRIDEEFLEKDIPEASDRFLTSKYDVYEFGN